MPKKKPIINKSKTKKASKPKSRSVKSEIAVNCDSGIGLIELVKVKEHKDGSADFTFDYDKTFEKYVAEQVGKSQLTKKEIGDFIVDMLHKAFDKTDGYNYTRD